LCTSKQGFVDRDKEQARRHVGGIEKKKAMYQSDLQNDIPQKTKIQPSSFRGIPLSVDCNISKWHRTRELVEQDIEGAAIHPPDSAWLVKYFAQCGWGEGLTLGPRCTKTLGSSEGGSEKMFSFT
jgi:hypothetical protein